MNHEVQHFLQSLVIVFATSTLIAWLFHKLRFSSIIGFLVAGIIIGPSALSLIGSTREIELFAEIGIILLLFTLGLEFSLKELLKLKKIVFGAGIFQIMFTVLIVLISFVGFFHFSWQSALLWGMLISLSSTAVVLKFLSDKKQTNSPAGRTIIAISLAQDLIAVIYIIILPMIAFRLELELKDIPEYILRIIIIFAFFFIGSRWLVPIVFQNIIKTRSRELFIFSIMLFCLGTGLFTNMLGLSLSLGAFLAGVMISESDYAHQALNDVIPFKESFMGLFFVSVGMLLNVQTLMEYAPFVLLIVCSIIVFKALITFIAVYIFDGSVKNAYLSGIALAQVGEFSFIIASLGMSLNLMHPVYYQVFLSASILTLIATPLLMELALRTSNNIVSLFYPKLIRQHNPELYGTQDFLSRGITRQHAIILGFGFHGKNIAQVLKKAQIPYVVIDNDLGIVRKYRSRGEPIYFGDATSADILLHLGLKKAHVIICTINDPIVQRTVIGNTRQHNKCAYIIIRTREVNEVETLKQLGANDVIPEEFETTMEILHRILIYYQTPPATIEKLFEDIRNKHYSLLTESTIDKMSILGQYQCIPDITVFSIYVEKDFSCIGKTIDQLDLRARTNTVLLAIRRDNMLLTGEQIYTPIQENDILIFSGSYHNFLKAQELLKGELK